MRAEIRADELLREMKEKGERQKAGDASGGNGRNKRPLSAPRLTDLGITKDQSSRWQKLAALPKGEQKEKIETAKRKAEAAIEQPSGSPYLMAEAA
jgi:hypothetical protein